jgi:hypothetical protein
VHALDKSADKWFIKCLEKDQETQGRVNGKTHLSAA